MRVVPRPEARLALLLFVAGASASLASLTGACSLLVKTDDLSIGGGDSGRVGDGLGQADTGGGMADAPGGLGEDTSVPEPGSDSGAARDSAQTIEDSGAIDSTALDAPGRDTSAADSSGDDTGASGADSGMADTGAPDTGAPDAGRDGGGVCAAGGARVFVTSALQTNGGNLGGVTGADQTCKSAATTAGLGGTWNAWLTDSSTIAYNRIYKATGAYYLVDGATIVAPNYNSLISGNLAHAIDVSEKGAVIADGQTEVWTGTDLSGLPSIGFCTVGGKDWSSQAASNMGTPMVGHLDQSNSTWTDAYYQTCDRTNVRLYCFERCP
jgi:hypothetical protein